MVKLASFPRRFCADTSGLALTEMLLVLPVLLLIWAAMIEFGLMMYQWNQTVKALQVGARVAAVSTPLTDLAPIVPTGAIGDPVPTNPDAVVSCGADATACDADALNRLLTGGDGCGATTTGVLGVCDVARFIQAENLRITYYRSGLGYIGRPFGPVLSVTLEVRNLNFDFLLLDDLLPGLASIAIPAHPVTITSEDLSDCDGACS